MSLSTSTYLSLSLLILISFALLYGTIIVAYAQKKIPATPVVSKVFRSNYSSIPITNTSAYKITPKLSKGLISNHSSIPDTNTASYTVTNLTFSFSTKVLAGDISRQFTKSNTKATIEVISGNKTH
jgi:hypothetical protein